jgi:hypothetical protein
MDYKGAALAKTHYIEKFISKLERVARAVYPPQKCPPHGVGATIFAKNDEFKSVGNYCIL